MLNEEKDPLEIELEKLRQQQYELQQKQLLLSQELQRKKAEEAERRRLEELNKPITIDIYAVKEGKFYLRCDYRPDLHGMLRETPTHYYDGGKIRSFSVEYFDILIQNLAKLERVELHLGEGIEEKIKAEIAASKVMWTIKSDGKQIIFVPGRSANNQLIYSIPGCNWDYQKKGYTASLADAWRIPQAFGSLLEDEEKIHITSEVKELIKLQLSRKVRLDTIASLEDIHLDLKLPNGYELRPFQRVGVHFLSEAGGNALLADDMGLGKTWQTIAYALYQDLKKVVVICPASLKPNWAREIKKLTGEYAYPLFGAEPKKHDIVNLLTKQPRFVIINYDILGRKTEVVDEKANGIKLKETRYLWQEVINMYQPDLIILDEGHYIKNVDSNRSKAARKLQSPRFIPTTGTPILNRPGEYWAVLSLIAPETFPSYENFLMRYTGSKGEARNANELRESLKPLMIRRRKKDVLKDLPPINRITEYHEMSPRALKIYDKVLQGVYEKIAAYDVRGEGGQLMSITSILAQIMRLKQVCAYDKAKDRTVELAQEIAESIQENPDNKVMIFSQFKATTYGIHQRLGHESLCFVHKTPKDFITIDAEERYRLVDRFQEDPTIKYLCVTEKTTKEGMNITAAGAVIFNDLFWTPAAHSQAEARAYGRLDNPHSISSYYLITDMGGDSIEEWIWELLGLKQDVINQVVEGIAEDRDTSIANELIKRIKDKMKWG